MTNIDYQKLIAHMGKEKKILEGQNKDLLAEVERLREIIYTCWKQSGESLHYLQVELLNDQEHWYQEMMCDDGSCEDCECDE